MSYGFEDTCPTGHVHNKYLGTCPCCMEGWEESPYTFGDINESEV